MKYKFFCVLLFASVLMSGKVAKAQVAATDYAHQVNTLIGTKGVGLASGYLYPGGDLSFWYGAIHAVLLFQTVGICD